jgi:hypothetical protein
MTGNRNPRRGWLLAVVLAIGLLFLVPWGRWLGVASLSPAAGMRSAQSNPASPLEAAEIALFDEGLAAALGGRPRIHAPGTLLTLEYTLIGAQGESLQQWQVRALELEPMLRDLGPEVWKAQVPDVEAKLRNQGGRVLRNDGSPGLPWEAVVRMPIGEPFEFAARDEPFQTIDFEGATERSARRADANDGRSRAEPVRIRVRITAACRADVRLGRDRKLQFAPNAIIPIPIGFPERRWVQMVGCTGAAPLQQRGSVSAQTL